MSEPLTAKDYAAYEARINRTDGCWLWTGLHKNGYPFLRVKGSDHSAARLAWQFVHGPIPANTRLFHSCGESLCVNPSHLEASARPGLLTVKQAAEAIGVNKSTIKRWLISNRITPTTKAPGQTGLYLFDADYIAKLAAIEKQIAELRGSVVGTA